MKKGTYIIMFILISGMLGAQSDFTLGIIPRINLGYKINSKISLKSSIETRKGVFDNRRIDRYEYENILTDYALFLSSKIDIDKSLNLGYLLRSENGEVIHRIAQHFNIIQQLGKGRLAHRFATDQTFSELESPIFRARYRSTLERSLFGERIDEREFYTKLGMEFLYARQSSDNNFEWRLIPSLGYELAAKSKIELGIDFRIKDLFESGKRFAQWMRLSWYYSFSKRGKK